MAALSAGIACALCIGHGPVPHCPQRFATDIIRAAHRFALPRRWICAVMLAESGGRPTIRGVPIVSPLGAMGLMQLMPHTFAAMAARYRLGQAAFAPRDNILAGSAYLHRCYVRFGFPLLFAAYEAGPRRVRAFIIKGMPLPATTWRYVTHILDSLPDTWQEQDRPARLLTVASQMELFVGATDGQKLFVPLRHLPDSVRCACNRKAGKP
ncbi:MAG: lytic transglycosylase domain-containing protein [Alphaproteobacteria bacterium]|nr:lytic transglycosylase domain-containing protein [Alphaproteobacteria bacterium]